MYAPSDTVTLMLMAMHIENTMTLKTYHAMNKTLLGSFESRSEGAGDTTIGALFRGGETATGKWHYGLGLSLPTGSIKQTGTVLTPMNMTATGKRLPYPMQLGSGSYDLKPSITYNGDWGSWRVGGQANAVVRLNEIMAIIAGRQSGTAWLGHETIYDWLRALFASMSAIRGKSTGRHQYIFAGTNRADKFFRRHFCQSVARCEPDRPERRAGHHRLAIEWVSPVIRTFMACRWSGKTH